MEIKELLTLSSERGASDLHLSAGEPPRLRIDGEMESLDHPALSAEVLHTMMLDIMADGQRERFASDSDVDFCFEIEGIARFRVNVFRNRRGDGAVFRTIPTTLKSMEDLGLPPVLKEVCDNEKGLILITGPTGSGKTTSLAAMIHHINLTYRRHVLTIEDPIEFVHDSKQSLINQREVGAHTESFSAALRGALREDPDVILVGEMRDLETISLAITAAETGHLVFGTLHTSSAAKTIDRVIDVFPAAQQEQIRVMFADSVQAICCQTLLKKIGGGRVPAMEVLLASSAIRNLIREGKTHQIPSAMQTGRRAGMQPLDVALQDLVKQQSVTKEEAQSRSSTPDLFGPPAMSGGAARPMAPVGRVAALAS